MVRLLMNSVTVVQLQFYGVIKSNYNKNGAIIGKRGAIRLSYLLNDLGDLNVFVCFFYGHIINFMHGKFQQILMKGTITTELSEGRFLAFYPEVTFIVNCVTRERKHI